MVYFEHTYKKTFWSLKTGKSAATKWRIIRLGSLEKIVNAKYMKLSEVSLPGVHYSFLLK